MYRNILPGPPGSFTMAQALMAPGVATPLYHAVGGTIRKIVSSEVSQVEMFYIFLNKNFNTSWRKGYLRIVILRQSVLSDLSMLCAKLVTASLIRYSWDCGS